MFIRGTNFQGLVELLYFVVLHYLHINQYKNVYFVEHLASCFTYNYEVIQIVISRAIMNTQYIIYEIEIKKKQSASYKLC